MNSSDNLWPAGRFVAIGTAVAIALSKLTTVHAQSVAADSTQELQEVVVTAERRQADLQKTGVSITALSGEALQKQGDTDTAKVLQNVPAVVVQSADGYGTTGGPPNIAIRGLGVDGSESAAVSVYEDGVLVTGGGANFYDLNRVEVLRGPQGTLYGRSATAGAVNIITNDPAPQSAASGLIEYGSYGLIHTEAMLNEPLTDDLSGRAAFNSIRHNGFFNNGQSDENEDNARLKLLYKPSENFSLLLGGEYWKSDSAGPGQVALTGNDEPTGWTTDVAAGSLVHSRMLKDYANLNWNMGFADLTYIPAYQGITEDGSEYGGPGNQLMSVPLSRTITQELRVSNPVDSKLIWVAGAYYYDYALQSSYIGEFAQPYSLANSFSVIQSEALGSVALFGEATYPLTDTLRLTGGLREDWDRAHNYQVGTSPYQHDFTHLDYKIRIEKDLSPSSLGYAMISTGYRPGGQALDGASYADEKLTAFEIGSKNRIGGVLQVNASVYYYDYSGFQQAEDFTLPPPNQSVVVGNVIVVVPATFYGGELEMVLVPTSTDRLTLSPAFEKGRYTGNIGYTNPLTNVTTNVMTDGGTPPHMPDFSISGDYTHTFPLPNGANIAARADAHYQSQQFVNFDTSVYQAVPNPAFVQQPFTIVDAALTYTGSSGKYAVSFYGKNLGNKIYKFLANPGPGGTTSLVNDPRTIGVIISASM